MRIERGNDGTVGPLVVRLWSVEDLGIFIRGNPILCLHIQHIEENIPIARQSVVEPGTERMVDFEQIEWRKDAKQLAGPADQSLPSFGDVKGFSILPPIFRWIRRS